MRKTAPTLALAGTLFLYGCSSASGEQAPAPATTVINIEGGGSSLTSPKPSEGIRNYDANPLIYVFTRASGKLALNGCMKGKHDGHKTLTTFGTDYLPPSVVGGSVLVDGDPNPTRTPNIRPGVLAHQALQHSSDLVTGPQTFDGMQVDCGPAVNPTTDLLKNVDTGANESWDKIPNGTVIANAGSDGLLTLPANMPN